MTNRGDEVQPMDRRVRRSRTALQVSAIELALAGGYDQCTVDQIVSRADVSRPTFYAHFGDKETLLDSALAAALDDIRTSTEAVLVDEHGPFGGEVMGTFFRKTGEHAQAMRVLLRGEGHGRPLQQWASTLGEIARHWFTRQLDQVGREPRAPLDLLAGQFAWSVIATLAWWLESHPELDAETVAGHFRATTLRGRAWSLHIDDLDLRMPATDPTGHVD